MRNITEWLGENKFTNQVIKNLIEYPEAKKSR